MIAQRKGAKVVNLEKDEVLNLLATLHHNILTKVKNKLPYFPEEGFSKRVMQAARKVPGFSIEEFEKAISAYRSILLHAEAKRKGCNLMVLGSRHARHLELLRKQARVGPVHEVHYSDYAKRSEGDFPLPAEDLRALRRYRMVLDEAVEFERGRMALSEKLQRLVSKKGILSKRELKALENEMKKYDM